MRPALYQVNEPHLSCNILNEVITKRLTTTFKKKKKQNKTKKLLRGVARGDALGINPSIPLRGWGEPLKFRRKSIVGFTVALKARIILHLLCNKGNKLSNKLE